jgi:hypothetical protein
MLQTRAATFSWSQPALPGWFIPKSCSDFLTMEGLLDCPSAWFITELVEYLVLWQTRRSVALEIAQLSFISVDVICRGNGSHVEEIWPSSLPTSPEEVNLRGF